MSLKALAKIISNFCIKCSKSYGDYVSKSFSQDHLKFLYKMSKSMTLTYRSCPGVKMMLKKFQTNNYHHTIYNSNQLKGVQNTRAQLFKTNDVVS